MTNLQKKISLKKIIRSLGTASRRLIVSLLAILLVSAAMYAYDAGSARAQQLAYIADDTLWDDYYIGGEGSVSSVDYVVGVSSVKITTVQRSSYNGISKEIFASPLNLAGKSLKLQIKSSDWSRVSAANLILSSDGYALSNTYTFDIKSQLQNPANSQWIEIEMPLVGFEKYGSPDWSNINFALLRIKDNGINSADLSMDGFGYYETTVNEPGYIADNLAWDDYYIGGEGSVSTTDYVTAGNSVKITTVQRSSYNGISKELLSSPFNLAGKVLKMYVKSSDWSKISKANIMFASDGYALSNTYTFDIKSQLQNPANSQWIEIEMPLVGFEKYGSPDWSNINFALLRIKDNGINSADLSMDGLSYAVPPATGQFTYIVDDTAWEDYHIGGEGSVSITDYMVGGNSVKLTTVRRSIFNGIDKNLSADPLNLAGKALRVYVKSSNWSHISAANLAFSSDGYAFGNTYTFDIKSQLQYPANGQWLEVVMPLSAFEKYGSPDWGSINGILLEMRDDGTNVAELYIDGLGYFDPGSFPGGVISITFDDGWADTYTQGKSKMDTYGYKGTAFVIPGTIGTAGYMTQAQIDGLSASGWDISGHGSINLTTLTDDQVVSDVSAARNYLVSKGYNGSHLYAYPNGATNSAVTARVKQYFSAGFNIDGMNQAQAYMNKDFINRQGVDMWTPLSQAEPWIDAAKNNNEWCIINFHTIVSNPSQSYDYSIADFGALIDYIYSLGIPVKTISEVVGS